MGLLLGEEQPTPHCQQGSQPLACKLPLAQSGREHGRERGRALPPPGCMTSDQFLTFLNLSVFIWKMSTALSLGVMGG